MKRMKIIFCSTSTHLNIESFEYQEFTFTIECQGPYGSCSFLCIGQQPSTLKLCLPAILPSNPASMVKTSATWRGVGWAVGKYLGDPCELSLGCKDTIRMMSSDFEAKMCHPKRLNLNLPPSCEGKKPRDAGVSALMIIPDQVFATGENGAIWSIQDWNSTVQFCLLCVSWQPLRYTKPSDLSLIIILTGYRHPFKILVKQQMKCTWYVECFHTLTNGKMKVSPYHLG